MSTCRRDGCSRELRHARPLVEVDRGRSEQPARRAIAMRSHRALAEPPIASTQVDGVIEGIVC